MLNKKVLLAKWKDFKLAFYLLNRNILARTCLILLGLIIVVALLAPLLAPYPADAGSVTHPEQILQAPSAAHWFGTDELGRDILSKVIFGARISLSSACVTVFWAMVIGCTLGAIAGSVRGPVDEIIMRVTDIFLSFPPMLLSIAITALAGASLQNAQMAMIASWWPWYTRLMRSGAVNIHERPYVKAAEAIGTKPVSIIFRHVMPNCMAPIIIQASMDMGAVILTLASLSYLGLGAQTPTPEWGLMVNTSKTYIMSAWWYCAFPALAILLLVLIFNIIGDALNEVLNPKSRKN